MDNTKEYWVIFKPGTSWTSWFTNRTIGHVSVITKDDYNWLEVSGLSRNLDIKILDCDSKFDVISVYKKAGYKIIYVERDGEFKNNFLLVPRLLTCIDIVKYYLGIKLISFTPYQFYKRLRRLAYSKKRMPKGIKSIKIIT